MIIYKKCYLIKTNMIIYVEIKNNKWYSTYCIQVILIVFNKMFENYKYTNTYIHNIYLTLIMAYLIYIYFKNLINTVRT